MRTSFYFQKFSLHSISLFFFFFFSRVILLASIHYFRLAVNFLYSQAKRLTFLKRGKKKRDFKRHLPHQPIMSPVAFPHLSKCCQWCLFYLDIRLLFNSCSHSLCNLPDQTIEGHYIKDSKLFGRVRRSLKDWQVCPWE